MARPGLSFEKRARDAVQFLHPGMTAEHDADLDMVYGRQRQFDVVVKSDGKLHKTYEAKDHGRRTEFHRVEAFETKVRELLAPPTGGGGVISAAGFQEGPLARARALRDQVAVRELYHLREVHDSDWEDRVRSFHLAFAAYTLSAGTIDVELPDAERALEPGTIQLARARCFVYDSRGEIKMNLLDEINARLRASRPSFGEPTKKFEPVRIEFDADSYLSIQGPRQRLSAITFTPTQETLNTSIALDLEQGARDTLIDCLTNQRHIIPDPDKAISASRTGFDVSLTYKDAQQSNLEDLELRQPDPQTAESNNIAVFANALQTRLLLRMLADESADHPSETHANLKALLVEATRNLLAGNYAEAESAYWEACGVATSLEALVNLAYISERRGDLNQALNLLRRSIELFPLEAEGFTNAISILVRLGRLDEARNTLEMANMLHAGHPELLRREAELLGAEGNWGGALLCYSRLCHIAPKDARVRMQLADCEFALNEFDACAWDAVQAVRLGLVDPECLAYLLRRLNEREAFTQSMQIGTSILQSAEHGQAASRELWSEIAIAAHETGNIPLLEQLIPALDPNDPTTLHLSGLAATARGDHAGATVHFTRYVAVEPDDACGWVNLAIVARLAGQHQKSHAALKELELKRSTDSTYWGTRTMTAARAGDYEDSLRSATRFAESGDAAALLIAASDEALQLGQRNAAAILRTRANDFSSTDAATLAHQALTLSFRALDETAALNEAEARTAQAIAAGASGDTIACAQFLVALASGDQLRQAAALRTVLRTGLSNAQALALSTAAESAGESELTLQLLDAYLPTAEGEFPAPEILRASALLRLGADHAQVQLLLNSVEPARTNSLDTIIRAHLAFGRGALLDSLALLDAAYQQIGGLGRSPSFALRVACLFELGRLGEAAALVHSRAPGTPLSIAAPRLSATDCIEPDAAKALLSSFPMLDKEVHFSPFTRGEEFVVLLLKDGVLSPTVILCADVITTLEHVVTTFSDRQPLLIRLKFAPTRTIATLYRGPGRSSKETAVAV